jgi:hypothetical protein
MIRKIFRLRIAAAVLALCAALSQGAGAEPIRMRSTPIPLNSGDESDRRVGEMTFLGGLELRASEKEFGGFSGLHVSPDGARMLAVSDMGYWLQADLVHDEAGALTGARNARLSRMLDPDGKPLSGKARGDAEGLFVTDDGILVSFEQKHRIWRYPLTNDLSSAVPIALPAPADISSIERNKGLEALVQLPGGALLLLTEESLDREGHIRGWLGAPGGKSYTPLRLKRVPPFAVTDAALLPGSGELLILERRFSVLGGLGIRLRRLPLSRIRPGALLDGPRAAEFSAGQNIDNFEGLATRPDGNGGALVYLLSDDNFNRFQRTLLMHFRLETTARPVRH